MTEVVTMEYAELGRTGLRVSVAGLGCGGHSRLGISQDKGEDNAVRIVSTALDLGVNFIDTAEMYGTEIYVGRAIKDLPRDQVVISTKVAPVVDGAPLTAHAFKERVDGCLSRLGVDYVDILHVHGPHPDDYPHARDILLPAIHELRDAGKVRFPAVSEVFARDTGHRMLHSAIADGWDVVMVGFNILNQSARERVLRKTQELGVGTLAMFAVRRALSQPDELRRVCADLHAHGLIDGAVDLHDPLGFLTEDGVAESVTEAAYRFCRHERGIDVVLTGTGSIEHLEQNVRSILKPALPEEIVARLRQMFGRVDSVSGN